MYNLNVKQIEFVASEVANADITFSHLKDDLIDHLCCEIEAEINRGLSFETALEKTKQKIGIKNLKKVQEDTLLLIDKKYRFMKNFMKISGLISMAMLAFGALFKIMHWPGAGPLLVFGFVFVSLLFFPTAMWVMKKESKLKSPIMLYISGLLGAIFVMIGFMFKIQHWPGASFLLQIGYVVFCLIFIPILLNSLLKSTQEKALKNSYILGAISFLLCFIGDFFKVMHWPGAGPMLIFGSILLVSVFVPYYTYVKYKNSKSIEGSFIFFSIGILFFTFFNNLLAINVSKDILAQFVAPVKKMVETTQNIEKNNQKNYELFFNDTLNKSSELKHKLTEIQSETNELCNYIKNLKIEIISMVDNVDKTTAEKVSNNPEMLMAKDNYDIPTYFLIGENNNGKASELKSKIEIYKNHLLQNFENNNSNKALINKLFDTNDRFDIYSNENFTWEQYLFYHNISISTLNILSNIELNVRLAENEAINQLRNSKNQSEL